MTGPTLAAAALLGVLLGAGGARACTLQTVGVLDVDLSHGAPVVDGEINGVKVKIMIDTGSTTTLVGASAGRALGLAPSSSPGGYVFGIGGTSEAYATDLKSLKIGTLTLADVPPIPVGGRLGPGIAMLVGDDFLSQFDVELDLANHVIRLFHADGCAPAQLVYWNKPYSQAALVPGAKIKTEVALNGRRAVAMLDTGASASLVDGGTAAGAGEPEPAHPELVVTGLGPSPRRAWVDDFASVQIGDETIAHARIQVSNFARDFSVVDPDSDSRVGRSLGSSASMLIGEDFLHAHHVMVDFKNHVMVFNYGGGPIFLTPGSLGASAQ